MLKRAMSPNSRCVSVKNLSGFRRNRRKLAPGNQEVGPGTGFMSVSRVIVTPVPILCPQPGAAQSSTLLRGALAPGLRRRHLAALGARLAQADRDRLLAARYPGARTAPERALLLAMHRRLHSFGCSLSVLCHWTP